MSGPTHIGEIMPKITAEIEAARKAKLLGKAKTNGDPTEMYGYELGEVVELMVGALDDRKQWINQGETVRLVAFTPKVFVRRDIPTGWEREMDRREYFFNAVRANQESDQFPRIRANFITIRKIKP